MRHPTWMDDRARLEAWIARSLAFRARLRTIALGAAAIALAVWWRSSTWGAIAMLIVASVWGAGWWITFGHIADWRARIEWLERRDRRRDPSPRAAD